MKIPSGTLPTTAPLPRGDRAGSHSQTWLAELERAWLQGWQNQPAAADGHPGTAARTEPPSPGTDGLRTSDANNRLSSDRRTDTHDGSPLRGHDDASRAHVPCRPLPEPAAGVVAMQAPKYEAHFAQAEQLRLSVHTDGEAVSTIDGGLPNATQRWPVSSAPQAVPEYSATFAVQAPYLPDASPEESGSLSAPPSDRHAARPAPHAKTMLHVAVNDSTAQVTLRDTQLQGEHAAATSRNLASQLLSMGVQSVRVYVNGVQTRHQPNVRATDDFSTHRRGVPAVDAEVPLNPSSLERN